MKILVSACLLGENCKYSGGNNYNQAVCDFARGHQVVPVCPEVLGGLPTPRCPAEIVQGVVTNKEGINVDREFRAGAAKALAIAKKTRKCGIDYILVGDYYIPDLKLPEEHRPIGKYGRLHREYLREVHPARLNTLILTGELWTYLADLNEQAQKRLDTIMEQMKTAEGVTEELKRTHQMEWVQRCNNIHNRAEEIVLQKVRYVKKICIGLYFRKIDFLNFAVGAIMPIIVLFIVYSSVKSNIIKTLIFYHC